jgi:hypothetical protein
MKAKLTDEASKSALAKLSGWSDVAGNDVASRVIRITMPKNRNEAAKQLRAGSRTLLQIAAYHSDRDARSDR